MKKLSKKENKKPIVANVLSGIASSMLSSAANSRCAFVYHQPKQPKGVSKFQKF